jgi:hypothetical protein
MAQSWNRVHDMIGKESSAGINLSMRDSKCNFTRMYAHIVEENGAFTVRVRMLNHLRSGENAWGEEIAPTLELASTMIETLACEFSIPQNCISLKILMARLKDGTMH